MECVINCNHPTLLFPSSKPLCTCQQAAAKRVVQCCSEIIQPKSMKTKRWSSYKTCKILIKCSLFWQAPTLYLPTVPTAPRWRNRWITTHLSWGWQSYSTLRCDVIMYAKNKTRGCSTDTPFQYAQFHIPLPAPEEKTSLAWRTLLSEAFTHCPAGSFCNNSCSLILPTHSSMGHTVQYSLFLHWLEAVCCFYLICVCVFALLRNMGAGVILWLKW